MAIHIALNHVTSYSYDKLINLGPHLVRLRPAPHCRTPILSYSLRVEPEAHFLNWQQDPYANYMARLVFPEKTKKLTVTVDLVAEMAVYNPFDFFLEEHAEHFPFKYDKSLGHDLAPYLATSKPVGLFKKLLTEISDKKVRTIDYLVNLNQLIQTKVKYTIRMEPGIQTPEETLVLGSGSCRDSAWLLVNLLRHKGLAARFVSGYLIQLKPDVKSL
ncbi:MAG: transglutaminase N-terminal domain-containing protein, partial [Polynucleobacter victoriensis]